MTTHVRKQIRAAAVTALTSLTTTGSNVFDSLAYPLQDNQLPALRIDYGTENAQIASMGSSRLIERTLELKVEACVKQLSTYNDTLDTILKEVEIAIAANQNLGGAKYVQLVSVAPELSGEGEKPMARYTMTFEVPYFTALGAPDVAL